VEGIEDFRIFFNSGLLRVREKSGNRFGQGENKGKSGNWPFFPGKCHFLCIFILQSEDLVRRLMLYYFHVNGSIGIVHKIDFEIRPDLGCTTPKTSRKVVLDNPSVCLSVCLAVAFPASSHRRKV